MISEERTTLSGNLPKTVFDPTPTPEKDENGMYKDYWVLSDNERAKGFIRPLRDSYLHKTCKAKTTMGYKLAETFARDNTFYTHTYCAHCRDHRPLSEFLWSDTTETVGS